MISGVFWRCLQEHQNPAGGTGVARLPDVSQFTAKPSMCLPSLMKFCREFTDSGTITKQPRKPLAEAVPQETHSAGFCINNQCQCSSDCRSVDTATGKPDSSSPMRRRQQCNRNPNCTRYSCKFPLYVCVPEGRCQSLGSGANQAHLKGSTPNRQNPLGCLCRDSCSYSFPKRYLISVWDIPSC